MRLYLERRGLLDDFERWQIELFTKECDCNEDN